MLAIFWSISLLQALVLALNPSFSMYMAQNPPPQRPMQRQVRIQQVGAAAVVTALAVRKLIPGRPKPPAPPSFHYLVRRPAKAIIDRLEYIAESGAARELIEDMHIPRQMQEPLRKFTVDSVHSYMSLLCTGKNAHNEIVRNIANNFEHASLSKVSSHERFLIAASINAVCAMQPRPLV